MLGISILAYIGAMACVIALVLGIVAFANWLEKWERRFKRVERELVEIEREIAKIEKMQKKHKK